MVAGRFRPGGRARARHLRALAALLLLGGIAPAPAPARESTPIKILALRPWRAFLEVEGSLERSEVHQQLDRDQELRRFREGVRLEDAGYVYHPRFLTFDASGLLSLHQFRLASAGGARDEERRTRLGSYSSRLSLLPEHALRAEWMADRSRSRVRVTDYRERDVEVRRQLFNLYWDRGRLPLEFRYEKGRREHTGEFGADERTRRAVLSGRYRDGRNTGSFRLERTRQRDDRLGYSLTRESGNLFARLFLREWHASTGLVWWRQDLGGRSETTRGNLELSGEMGAGFEGGAGLELRRTDRDGLREDAGAGRVHVSHRLYESLFTDATAHFQDQHPDGQALRTFDLDASSTYRKIVPRGRIALTGSFRRLRRDARGETVVATVSERKVRFDETGLVLLAETGIDASTFRLTDSTGTIIYRLDEDYELEGLAGGTILRRRPKGEIPSGALLKVSFRFATRGDALQELETVGGSALFRADAGPYFRIFSTRSRPLGEAEDGSPGFQPSHHRELAAGWTARQVRLDWERSTRSDRILPHVRERLTLHAGTTLGSRAAWSADASRGWSEFPSEGEHFDFRDVRGSVRVSFPRVGTWALAGGAREDESESGRSRSWFVSSRGLLRLGVGEVTVEWREERTWSEGVGTHRRRNASLELRRRIR